MDDRRMKAVLWLGRRKVQLECGANNFLETLQVFMDDNDATMCRLNGVVSEPDLDHVLRAVTAALDLPGIKKVFYERGRVFIGPSRGRWIEFCRIY